MEKEEFVKRAIEIADKRGATLVREEYEPDCYGKRRKYQLETSHGVLRITIIDRKSIYMRWLPGFDRNLIDKMFGLKPSPQGLWNIHDKDPELVLTDFDLRLEAITHKKKGHKKAA